MIKLYILLGGNLGDKQLIFSETKKQLTAQLGAIAKESAIYETEPWGFESDDMFWNQALEFETELTPEEVLVQVHNIEHEMGRIRTGNQYDSRLIDIDILFFGNQVINQEYLVIPHPRIQDRKFVLVPLAEIAPEMIHPIFKKTINKLLEECTDHLSVQKLTTHNS